MFRLMKEDDILDAAIRARIIEEIEGPENRRRKHLAYRRYQCYKDKTVRYVVENLLRQFDLSTVVEMRYCLSNISIAKKVIDKLARVYNFGVDRGITSKEQETERIKNLDKALKLTQKLKKTNKFVKLQRNIMLYLKSCPSESEPQKWTIVPEPLQPFHYDVIEQPIDRTKPMVVILSDYKPEADILLDLDGQRYSTHAPVPASDGKDQLIADKGIDNKSPLTGTHSDEKFYVFWTENYHFTTNDKGQIVKQKAGAKPENDIGTLPFVNYAIEQDGAFWAEGGDDLIDGAILINALISHVEHVGVVQGYGQLFMSGKNLPRSVKVGPTKAIIAEYDKDEHPKPEMQFLSANPQLDSLRGNIEMYIALLLTTNNLSTSGISATLQGSKDFASGIALVIDKSESVEDVQEQRQLFIDNEPMVFKKIAIITQALGTGAADELKENSVDPKLFEKDFYSRFHDAPMIMTEKEKLEVMKLRKEMGIDSIIDMLKKDDPTLDDAAAEAKLRKILEENIKAKMLEQELGAELAPEPEEDPAAPAVPGEEKPEEDPEMMKPEDEKEEDPEEMELEN